MFGLNPLSGATSDAALTLGLPLELLQARIAVGDLLAATVLAPQNGQDLIEILGQQVVAQLPPGVHPGETLLLQVTGLSGTQIFVQNLGPYDPQNPPAVLPVPAEPAGSATSGILTTVRPIPETPAVPPPIPQAGAPISPPSAVFVAASVRPAKLQPAPASAAASPQSAARAATPVEARIAAAQTANPQTAREPLPAARVPQAIQNVATAAGRAIRSVGDLLRAARLPDTPLARTAAAIAPAASSRLPGVLARLEAALPRQSSDPRIATLRTIAAFVGRMSVQNEETLAAQISSYVSNAVEGAESKLAQLLQAAATLTDSAPPHPGAQNASAPASPHREAPAAPLENTVAQARVAERTAAVDHDLKSLVLSLLRDPPHDRTPALSQALNETLVTITGTQINVLANHLQDPNTLTIGLPVYYREGGKPAQIRISRDGSSGAPKLDADNFHVAFVLDTAHLGTVAIDLQTTGRAVKVEVKTEQPSSASRFSKTLSSLQSRLEHLRYRVTSAAAAVAARGTKPEKAAHNNSPGVDMRA